MLAKIPPLGAKWHWLLHSPGDLDVDSVKLLFFAVEQSPQWKHESFGSKQAKGHRSCLPTNCIKILSFSVFFLESKQFNHFDQKGKKTACDMGFGDMDIEVRGKSWRLSWSLETSDFQKKHPWMTQFFWPAIKFLSFWDRQNTTRIVDSNASTYGTDVG